MWHMDGSTNQHSAAAKWIGSRATISAASWCQVLMPARVDERLVSVRRMPREALPDSSAAQGGGGQQCAVSNLEEAQLCCVCSVLQYPNFTALCTDAKSVGAANVSGEPVSVC